MQNSLNSLLTRHMVMTVVPQLSGWLWRFLLVITIAPAAWPSSAHAHTAPPVTLTTAERAFIQAHPVLTLGTSDAWEPYVIVGSDGHVSGYDADILAQIKRLTGLDIRLLPGDWRLRQEQAQRREIDGLSTGGIHPERRTYLNFSDPYIRLNKFVLVTKGNPHNIRTRADLDGRTIAIHRGNLADEKIAQGFPRSHIVPLDSVDAVIDAVSSGRVDATFDNGSMLYRANRIGSPYLQFALSINESLELAFGVRTDWPEAISIINKALTALGDDERQRIQARWFLTPLDNVQSLTTRVILNNDETEFLDRLGAIRLCIDPNWMPIEALLPDGTHQGILHDLITELMQRLGRSTELVRTASWEESLSAIRAGRCDMISGAAITPERSEYLNFTRPLLTEPLVLAIRSDNTFDGTLDHYFNQTFIMVSGHAAIELLRRHYPAMRIVEAPDVATAIRAVANGNAFGYIDLLPTITWIAQHNNILNIKIAGNLDEYYELAIAVRKELPLLLSALSKAVASLHPEEIQAIRAHWISIRYEQPADYRWLWPYFTGGILLLIVMSVWTHRLSRLNDALRAANIRITLLTITDELTGLFNRRHFHEVMEREWRRALREQRPLHLLVIDIDYFKLYNDNYGHPAGDVVLKRVGELLNFHTRRGSDFAFRIGGEEFAVLLTETNQEAALVFAESLRSGAEQLAIPHAYNAIAPVVTLSLGLVCILTDPTAAQVMMLNWEMAYHRADELLYHAKTAGRNRVIAGQWHASTP
ncbi:diguanylate cyclase [Chromatium okenii]|uniref:diguanylate cyclase n=1 Tax=Chromatium okenii TaxID=61644 RepID=UPI00190336D5|nr:transporter substrate-binding domain-containing protein [Chromatium okenii]